MAKLKKKRKKKLGGRSSGGGQGGKKITPLRPYRDPKMAPCLPACPIGNDIRGALAHVGSSERCDRTYEDAFNGAFYIFARTNPMPATVGRLCIRCCEKECNRQHINGQVNNRNFERFIGDNALEQKLAFSKLTEEQQQGRIAVVGAGPAGLSCAYHLAQQGWSVTIFEAHSQAGGFLRYVAPFRLPRSVVDAEVQRILDLGVELRTGVTVGQDVTMEALQQEYSAIFVAVGAHQERKLGAPWQGENVLSAAELQRRVNAGESLDLGDNVLVLGGTNDALDAARTCKRLGVSATVVYSRTRDEMSAYPQEVTNAEAEGIDFEVLAKPVELVKEGDRAVKLICQRLKLDEPDSRGRKRGIPIPGEVFERPVSFLISTFTQDFYADSLSRVGLQGARSGYDGSFKSSVPKVYAGGDANKLNMATIAVGQGRKAAEAIHADLTGAKKEPVEELPIITHDKMKLDWYEVIERHEQGVRPVEERFGDGSMNLEASLGFSKDDAIAESKRCFSCGMCMDCDNCWMYCQDQAVDKLPKTEPVGEHYYYKFDLCTGCEKCAEECPCRYLKMV